MSKSDQLNKATSPPQVDEYLPAAIQKAVVQNTMKHPVTIYPIALGVSSGVVGALFNLPVLLATAVGLFLAGPAWAVIQIFFRHEALGSRYLASLHERQKQYEAYLIDKIESGLKECAATKELKSTAVTAIAQLQSIRVKLANIQELLQMKLRTNEITYGRFLGAAEQVSLGVLDNLNSVTGILTSMTSIDFTYVQARLKELSAKSSAGQEDLDQRSALQARLDLWRSQLRNVEQFIARNEDAMTEMEHISAAIAQWRTERKFADNDFESTLKQLQVLAQQAQEYNHIR